MGEMAEYALYGMETRIIGGYTVTHGPPPLDPRLFKRALMIGTYWVNWKGEKIPLRKIDKVYAKNIRALIRRRMRPKDYLRSPLYVNLGRIRKNPV